jgi:hypothetical protein
LLTQKLKKQLKLLQQMSRSDFIDSSEDQLSWVIAYLELKCSSSGDPELVFILTQLYSLRSLLSKEGDIR